MRTTVVIIAVLVLATMIAGDENEHDRGTGRVQFSCDPPSGQHGDYIQNNLEFLKKKCEDFQKCTDALYSAENFHRVLAGEDLELSNICGLLHKNDGGRYGTVSDECRESEREAIRRDIDSSLTKALVNLPRDHTQNRWRDLGNCVGRNRSPGNKETPVNKVCRLKENSNHTLGFLCDDHGVDAVTEKFFNRELERLHCSCATISTNTTAATPATTTPQSLHSGIAPLKEGGKLTKEVGICVGLGLVLLTATIA